MNIYFLSGLGVDKRVFQNLTLSKDLSSHDIDWIEPLPRETISSYAKRLSAVIDQTKPFVLIGLSFGGMIAIEMNQFVRPAKTIIISSAANQLELPWFVKIIRFMPLYKVMPLQLFRKPNRFFYYLFGIKTQGEKNLLNEILHDTSPSILIWSINAISNWRNKTTFSNVIHIHGTADKLLPIKYTKTHITVEGGEHFMIYSRAREISQILNELLAQPQL